jgi:bleomycin hydrolase
MFEVAVDPKHLPPKLRQALGLKPIVLPPWDPMGALAD